MSKETLQHTMRSKVRVFEDGGIRLLRKGQKGLIHAIFSRFGLVLVLLVLQFGALFSLMRWFSNLLPHYLGGTLLVTAAMMVYLLNQDMNNSVRIPWLVVTALAPVLGVLLFCYTKEDVGHRMLKKACWSWRDRPAASWRRTKRRARRWTRTAPARPLWRSICADGAAASRCTKTRR